MQTKTLALMSTVVIGLGGAALAAQQADQPRRLSADAVQSQADGIDALTGTAEDAQPDTGIAADQRPAADPPMAPGQDIAQPPLADDDPAREAAIAADPQPGAGQLVDRQPAPTISPDPQPGEGVADRAPTDDRMLRARSVTTAATPFTGAVLADMTAEELIGMNVVDAQGQSVGTITDLLMGDDDRVDRAIVDVGGILGFGTRSVAFDIDQLTLAEGDGEVVVDMSRQQIEVMPEWHADDQGWHTGG